MEREILAQSGRFCRESLPRFPRTPPLQGWEEKAILASWSQTELRGAKQSPGTGPGKKTGAGRSSSGWESVFPGTKGPEEQCNVYLMTFLSKQPPCQRPRLKQSLAPGQTEDKGKPAEPAREARVAPRERLDSKVWRRLIKVTTTATILSESAQFLGVRLGGR